MHLDILTDGLPLTPQEKKQKPKLHFILFLPSSCRVPSGQEKQRGEKKRLQCWLSFASLDETLFMGEIFCQQFQEKGSLTAISCTPTLFEFKQISTNEHGSEKYSRGDFSLSQVIIILMRLWRARGFLALTCKNGRQCAAGKLCCWHRKLQKMEPNLNILTRHPRI